MRNTTAAAFAALTLAAGCGPGGAPEPAAPAPVTAPAVTTTGPPPATTNPCTEYDPDVNYHDWCATQPGSHPRYKEEAAERRRVWAEDREEDIEDRADEVCGSLWNPDLGDAARIAAQQECLALGGELPYATPEPEEEAEEESSQPAGPEAPPVTGPPPTTAPLPTAPPDPPAGEQPAPDGSDVAQDIEDAGAETSDIWHRLGDKVLMSELIDATSGPAHDGSLVPVPVPLDRWCVYGPPLLPWNPGEWIVEVSTGDLAVIYDYYRVVGIEEWTARVWPHQYVAKVRHYWTVYPPGIDPLPPVALPDEDNLSGDYEDMGTPNPFRLIEISAGSYAVNVQQFKEGEEVRCGDS